MQYTGVCFRMILSLTVLTQLLRIYFLEEFISEVRRFTKRLVRSPSVIKQILLAAQQED